MTAAVIEQHVWPKGATAERPTGATADSEPGPARLPPNLPAAFWEARKALTHIRQAAHAYGRSADAVFANVLARTSAMAGHQLRFNFGLGPGSLNMFCAVVGPSGSGKTAAHTLAAALVTCPDYLLGDRFRDGIGLGSGEGMAEAYMGVVERETGETYRSGPNKGMPKLERVRGQVRHNVFFYVDEGETLTRTLERAGTTIGPAIRTAWVGATLGQANARDETTRMVPAGEYAMGMAIGYQPETAQPLLADAAAGTPQRFAWFTATDPTVPNVPPDWPGELWLRLESPHSPGDALEHVMTCDEKIRRELWEYNLARVRGEMVDVDLDSHVPYMRSKIAALLALLDGGRVKVTQEDWQLAEVVWNTSCAVRDGLIDYGQQAAAAAREQATARFVEREERAQIARAGASDRLVRIARRIAIRIHDDGAATRGDVRRALAGRDRPLSDAAVAYAIDQDWIVPLEDKILTPGDARPV